MAIVNLHLINHLHVALTVQMPSFVLSGDFIESHRKKAKIFAVMIFQCCCEL